jgi:hypothetical protein
LTKINSLYIKLHYEFIRKYSLYKLLKSKKCDEFQFLYLIEKKYPYFLNLALEIFPNKEETINFFLKIQKKHRKHLMKFLNVMIIF